MEKQCALLEHAAPAFRRNLKGQGNPPLLLSNVARRKVPGFSRVQRRVPVLLAKVNLV